MKLYVAINIKTEIKINIQLIELLYKMYITMYIFIIYRYMCLLIM